MNIHDLRINETINYLFHDTESGVYFFVEFDVLKDHCDYTEYYRRAYEIATDNFDNPVFVDVVSQEEAEMWGYETY